MALRRWVFVLICAFVAPSVLLGCAEESEATRLAKARSELQNNQVRAATIELKSLLQQHPLSGEGRLLLGWALLESGDAAGAVLELEKARGLKFSDDQVLPLLARALLSAGRPKVLIDTAGDTRLVSPKAQAELDSSLATAHFALGMNERGDAAVAAALRADPKNVSARILKSRRLAGQGRVEDALAVVDEVIADLPNHMSALVLKAELQWIARNDPEAAVAILRQALTVQPADIRAHTLLIQIHQQRKDAAGFKDQVSKLVAVAPNSIEAHFYRTQAAMLEGNVARATEGVQQLLKRAPNHGPVLHLAGVVELHSNDLELAKKHLTQAITAMPDSHPPRRTLAQAQLRSGQPERALATLSPLLNLAKPDGEAMGLAAEAHLQRGDLLQAQALYRQAAQAGPSESKPQVALALIQVARGDAAGGIEQLRAQASADKSVFADMALISTLIQRRELQAALQAVDRLQEKQPDKSLPHLLRGRLFAALKKPVDARASFDKAMQMDPVNFAVIAELAELDLAEGKPAAARKRFEALLVRDPGHVEASLAIIELRRRGGERPQALEPLLAAAVKKFPTEARVRLALIQHYLVQRQPQAALAAAQEAQVALPGDARVLDALGTAQLAAGDSGQAISTLRKIIALQPNSPQPHLRLAEVYVSMQDYPAATRSLHSALDVSPNSLAAQQALVKVSLLRKRPDEALRTARSLQKQRPSEAVGHLLEADVHLSQKAWGPAADALRAALDREPSSGTASRLHALYVVAGRLSEAERFAAGWEQRSPRDTEFLFNVGLVTMGRNDLAGAEKVFRRILTLAPDNAASLNNLALTMLKQNNPEALPLAQKALALRPQDPAVMDTLAAAFAADKQLSQALEWQRKAVATDPTSPLYRFNLAKLLIASGERAQARAELEKLVPLGGRFAAHAEVTALLKTL